MDLRQLRYFAAVGQVLNVSRAAVILNVSQPALSRQVQALEEELGVVLVDRSERPLKLTSAGAYLLDQALLLLEKADQVAAATRRLGQGQRHWMGIGFVPSLLYSFLPEMLRRFGSARSDIELSLSEMTSLQQTAALKAGRIDVGFGRVEINDPQIATANVARERLMVAMPAGLHAQPDDAIALADIVKETVILYPAEPRPSFADHVIGQLVAEGHPIRQYIETNNMHTALGLVAAGSGCTLLPASTALLHRPDVVYRPIAGASLSTVIYMAVRANDHREQLVAFTEMARECLADFDPESASDPLPIASVAQGSHPLPRP
ncbi:LysR family transcriptional regulator [Sphingobium subterraneum]|uniref:DNA-binding transcriptional LysR family regulator n=1 Tax=Sphingobium subterraneum TaxID=627688 RepID=A0A841IY65_9SPHN|nr:LysR family transcriptional regulator [Sphingobium subterraneum]MBB6123072.1 DNA-binding transcriptional LysR family regulator [Sphingobium subterraneum]